MVWIRIDCPSSVRSRLEVFLGKGGLRHFSTFLPMALTHAGIEIHDSGCYHTIVRAEEYCHVGQTEAKLLVSVWED